MNRQALVQTIQTSADAASAGRILQRTCACGNHTPVGGACDGCARENTQFRRKMGSRVSFNERALVRESNSLSGQMAGASTDGLSKRISGTDLSRVKTSSLLNSTRAPEPPTRNELSRDEKSQAEPEAPILAEAPAGPVAPTPATPAPDRADPLEKGTEKPVQPPAPTTKIVTQTAATTPADRTRKTIGIGEKVKCSTDPATAATWSVSGGGAVSPAAGNSTTFTAKLGPSKPTVKATVGGTDLTVDFDVVAPNGLTSTVSSNPGLGTKGPPNNQIGFETIFECTVEPTTVSFSNVEFRENIPKNNWTYPDGTADSQGPTVVPWRAKSGNKTPDDVSTGLEPIARLSDGTKNVAFGFTIKVPEDYKNDAGTWVNWLPNEEHYKEFDATGKGRGTLKATNNASGAWQGPWR
jgi:hypothetical protein